MLPVTMERKLEVVSDLSNGTIFSDLKWSVTSSSYLFCKFLVAFPIAL